MIECDRFLYVASDTPEAALQFTGEDRFIGCLDTGRKHKGGDPVFALYTAETFFGSDPACDICGSERDLRVDRDSRVICESCDLHLYGETF